MGNHVGACHYAMLFVLQTYEATSAKTPKKTLQQWAGGQSSHHFHGDVYLQSGGGHFPEAFPRHAKVYDQWRPASDDQKN